MESTSPVPGGTVKANLDNVQLTGNANGIHARQKQPRHREQQCVLQQHDEWHFRRCNIGLRYGQSLNSSISLNGGNGVRAGNLGGGVSGVEIGQNQINQNTGNGVLIGTGGAAEDLHKQLDPRQRYRRLSWLYSGWTWQSKWLSRFADLMSRFRFAGRSPSLNRQGG